jgi:hypothetical protein
MIEIIYSWLISIFMIIININDFIHEDYQY